MIDPGVCSALRAASPCTSASASHVEDGFNLAFFHNTQHVGSGKIALCYVSTADANNLFSMIESASYPRLYVPNQGSLAKESHVRAPQLYSLVGRCTR